MPYQSKSQQRLFFAMEDRGEVPEGTAERWAHHTKDLKHLPEHVRHKKAVADLAEAAVANQYATKLAAAAEISTALVGHLAGLAGLSVVSFVKHAYADPDGFIGVLQLASGAVAPAALVKQALMGSELLKKVLSGLQRGGSAALRNPEARLGGVGGAAGGLIGALEDPEDRLGGAARGGLMGAGGGAGASLGLRGGTALGRRLLSNPSPNTALATLGGAAAAGGGLGMAGGSLAAGGLGLGSVNKPPAAPEVPKAAPAAAVRTAAGGAAGGRDVPAAGPAGRGAGLSPAARALLLGGGVGLGALGLGAFVRNRKKKEVTAADRDFSVRVMRRALFKKAAAVCRAESADLLCRHLDAVAARLPLAKAAAVRAVQHGVSAGQSLAGAVKRAYPHLSDVQVGVLGSRMVRSAFAWAEKLAAQGPAGMAVPPPPAQMAPGGGGRVAPLMPPPPPAVPKPAVPQAAPVPRTANPAAVPGR